jgi:hypothetical protein
MKLRMLAVILVVLSLAGLTRAAEPEVVRTWPDNGETDVAAEVKEIRVEFDQPMNPGGRSVVGGGESFPQIAGEPRWVDAQTFVIPVKLEPDHAYQFSLNSDTFKGFQNENGEPAEWYPVRFHTRAAGAAPAAADVTPAQNRRAIAALRWAIDRDYAYRDLKKVDWAREIAARVPAMENAKTANEFARLTAHLLRLAEDAHVSVQAGNIHIVTRANSAPPNFNVQTLRRAVPGWAEEAGGIITGRFDAADSGKGGIGYILFSQCTAEQADGFDRALDNMKHTRALILDARFNGGGDEEAARKVAGRFVDHPAVYSRDRLRRDGEWKGPFDRVVEPRKDAERYAKPVVLLIGPKVVSSAESFVLMMRYGAKATLIGEPTGGSSGRPVPNELGNGVTVYLSSWEDQLPNGTLLEGRGVQPDIQVKTTLRGLANSDAVLETALQAIKELSNDGNGGGGR